MSLPYHKPPPYLRPNWDTMNEGQRRYAMEQYNLALVRRGAQFTPPSSDESDVSDDESVHSIPPQRPHTLYSASTDPGERNIIDELDDLDELMRQIRRNAGVNSEASEAGTPPDNASPVAGPSGWVNPHRQIYKDYPDSTPDSTASMASPMDVSSSSGSIPSSQPGKHKLTQGNTPSAKRQAIQASGSSLPGTSGNTDGSIGGGPTDGDGVNAVEPIPRGIYTPTYSWVFKKQWKFLSFGVADQIISEEVRSLGTGVPAVSRWCLTTSLVNIPWEYGFFYLTPAEMRRLQQFNGVFANKCKIKITQYNPRVAFQTGDTTSTQATLNQNKFTRWAIGLRENANIWGADRDYAFNNVEPMKPESIERRQGSAYRKELALAMYGAANDTDEATVKKNVPAHCTGQELALLRYFTVYAPKDKDVSFAPYNKFTHEKNSMDLLGREILSHSYNFTYAPIKERARNYQTPAMTVGEDPLIQFPDFITVFDGNKVEKIRGKNLSASGGNFNTGAGGTIPQPMQEEGVPLLGVLQRGGSDDTPAPLNPLTFDNVYTAFPLEQAGAYQELNSKFMHYDHQPSIHVGVRAVPKLGTSVNDLEASSWLDTQLYFVVDCELHVSAADPFTYPRGEVADILAHEQCIARNTSNIPQGTTIDLPYIAGKKQVINYN